MSIAGSLLPEFDIEMAGVRRVLERVPEAHVAWKPHTRSMTMGGLALHLTNIPTWVPITLKQSEFDLGPGNEAAAVRQFTTRADMLEEFDRNVVAARDAIRGTSDDEMVKPWSLKKGGETVLTMPRLAVLRSFVMNHAIHHRGQLTVYLRMKDVPLPAIYGRSADEE